MLMNPRMQTSARKVCFPVLAALLFPLISAQANQPHEPWIEELVYGTNDLVAVVSFDVTREPYSADPTGVENSTEAFVAAIADAARHGGTVFAPAGHYRITKNLTIPNGVTLRGDWKPPTEQDVRALGTALLAYPGRGEEDGKAFLQVNGGGVRDLSIFYPEQNVRQVVPYPTTIDLGYNSEVRNITLVNAYTGIVTGSFSTVVNLHGTPLKRGIVMRHAYAVPRCTGLSFSPRYWSQSGLPESPPLDKVRQALIREKAYGVQLNRQDGGIFMDVSIDHYPVGVKVMPPHGWTYWHDLRITNAEVGIHFTGGNNQRLTLTGSTISASRYGILMQMDKTEWKEGWEQLSKGRQPFGVDNDLGRLRMYDCRFEGSGTAIHTDGSFRHAVELQSCTFASWGSGPDDYAIRQDRANLARLDVFDSVFEQSGRHVRFEGNNARMIGNRFQGRPEIRIHDGGAIDHTEYHDPAPSPDPLVPVPGMLPARTGADSLYVVTSQHFGAPNDGEGDATPAIQTALDHAGRADGGTVYLPQGRYRITGHLKVPAGVELRGVNDFMPRGNQIRTLLIADVPNDRGHPENPPLITLESSPDRGGSGIAGLAIWYLHQDFTSIQPFPWTIRSMGPGCWVQRVYMGNLYNGIDFASHHNDRHVLSRVNGSALNIGFKVGNSPEIGWIDHCHIRPQDWMTASNRNLLLEFPGERNNKPTRDDVFRGTEHSLIPNMRGAGAITVTSGANVQITGFFTNGSTRAFDFIDHAGTGGGNANILIGGSEAGWGSLVRAVGDKGVNFVNFTFNPMSRLPYVKQEEVPDGNLPVGMVMRITPEVPQDRRINFIASKFYARPNITQGFDVQGGHLYFKQVEQEHHYSGPAVVVGGGLFSERNTRTGETIEENDE